MGHNVEDDEETLLCIMMDQLVWCVVHVIITACWDEWIESCVNHYDI